MHESQSLGIDLVGEKVETCRVAARLREARYQAHCYRVLTDAKHNWNSVGCSLGGERSGGIAGRCDHGDLPANQIRGQCWQLIVLTICPAVFDRDVLTLDV